MMLTLELTTLRQDDRPVYVAGNFNEWKGQDERYRMEQVEETKFRFTFPEGTILPSPFEYKYLRGDWTEEELDASGNGIGNRRLEHPTDFVQDTVPHWKRNGLHYNPDLLPQIQVLDENFEIPQLIKTRRIAALLPHDYEQTDKHYPVLYLQDGQNLFDDYAPFGNWGVDKRLAILTERGLGDIIIIAIDHAEAERIAEFTPSYETRLGIGQGKKYVRFLADTLKPYVDKRFRTKTEREHTGIGGSSLGGLISIYAGMMYPEVYDKLMIFSPSLWVTPQIPFNTIAFTEPMDARIYLYAGGKESKNMIPNVKRFKQAVERSAHKVNLEFELAIDPNGEHTETRWGEEFPRAVEWLFFNNAVRS